MYPQKRSHRVAIVGTGTIGASWATHFLARGLHVTATDPAPHAEAALRSYVAAAWDTACARNDKVALLTIREWGLSLDPKRTIQPEMLDRMRECTKPAAPKGNVAK